jgi:type II secretory pathway component GspD/PulD (secretin)
VQFSVDAWPGEERTYVVDEVAAALALAHQYAVEYDPEGAVVVVTGRPELVEEVAGLVR